MICSCGNTSKIILNTKAIPYIEATTTKDTSNSSFVDQDTKYTKQKADSSIFDVVKGKRFKEEADHFKKEFEKIKVKNENIISELKKAQEKNNKLMQFKEEAERYRKDFEKTKVKNKNLINELKKAEDRTVELILKNKKYETLLCDDHYKAIEIKEYLKELKVTEIELSKKISCKENQITNLQEKIQELKKEIIVLDDEILYQSFGLYTPIYDLQSSKEYKKQIEFNRELQKKMIKDKTAANCTSDWRVNNSIREGKKMINNKIKETIRCFNTECEGLILKVKFNNYGSIRDRIYSSFKKLNELNESLSVTISNEYLKLKYAELDLCYEYALKRQEEKEEAQILREQQREEAKLIKEIEERRREIEKEQQHYNNALKRLNDQIETEKSDVRLQFLLDKKKEIENNLIDLDKVLKEVDYREANQRAGYVYIISNIGAFGENVYKIGMTRRLDPQERIDELSNASVPFKYDIHTMIFSDDAPKLENVLHRAFEHRRINMMNNRKEFFKVTLNEIEEVVIANHDKSVEFVKVPPAQQYRESLKIKS